MVLKRILRYFLFTLLTIVVLTRDLPGLRDCTD